ncbi:hypothetical protein [Streptomyces sp. NPDC059862]|uniref:hypothetical protein n=1 Tax=unclassified Streptomyces TaxID=2593676 RepID=UPI0036361D71
MARRSTVARNVSWPRSWTFAGRQVRPSSYEISTCTLDPCGAGALPWARTVTSPPYDPARVMVLWASTGTA